MGTEQMGVASYNRQKDILLDLRNRAGLTQTEASVLLAQQIPLTRLLDMTRAELMDQYPLAFRIQEVAEEVKPSPEKVRAIRGEIKKLPRAVREAVLMVAVAAIATLTL